ncbi:MAG: AI-2E family transporter [Lachnospiraceae bacterium]|nr:AI-2E family transporter [Lachnospiraceae bacterium]
MEAKEDIKKRDRRTGGGLKSYAGIGITAFLVLAAVVLLVFVFVRLEDVSKILDGVKTAFAPIMYGAVFAYLMNPLMVAIEGTLKNLFHRKAKNIIRADKAARTISVIITLIVLVVIIAFLVNMLVPELKSTIMSLGSDLPGHYQNLEDWYYGLDIRNTQVGELLDSSIIKAGEYIEDFIDNKLLATVTNVMTVLASSMKSVFGIVYNVLVGLVASIYILGSKEKILGISKKITYACFKRRNANTVIRIARQCHVKFTNAFMGKLIDSFIIGMICFLIMYIFKFPYAVLISVVIGVTNVVPFFGPIIGAVPSAFLVLVADPHMLLYFLIMIVALQQFDSNILTPKIMGETIGLSPIWVLFGCVFFGSLWGVGGMLLAVPLTACIYMIVKEIVENRLYRKGLELDTAYYQDLEYEDETEMFRPPKWMIREEENDPGESGDTIPAVSENGADETTASDKEIQSPAPTRTEPENKTDKRKKKKR